MSENALRLAKEKILEYLTVKFSDFSAEKVDALAMKVLERIDWNDTALMHKDLQWITERYSNQILAEG